MSSTNSSGSVNIIFPLMAIFVAIKSFSSNNTFLGLVFLFLAIILFYSMVDKNTKTNEKKNVDFHDYNEVRETLEPKVFTPPVKKSVSQNDDIYSTNINFDASNISNSASQLFKQISTFLASDDIQALSKRFDTILSMLLKLSAVCSKPEYQNEVMRVYTKNRQLFAGKVDDAVPLSIVLNPKNEQILKDIYADRLMSVFNSTFSNSVAEVKEKPAKKQQVLKQLLDFSDTIKQEIKRCGMNDKIRECIENISDKRQEIFALKISFD